MHTEKLAHSGAITNSLLICAAIEAEVDRLRVQTQSLPVECLVCGVGNVAAALSLSARLSAGRFDEILFVGSCGVYGEFGGNYEAAYSREFVQSDLAVLSGRAKQPVPFHAKPRAGAVSARLKEIILRQGVTNCPDSVSLDLSGADIEGLAFENMECYGLASAALKYDAAFSAVFAVTNAVGPSGSNQWRENYRKFSDLLQKEIADCLTSLWK
jgi:nucleoside phosphorylase